MPEAVGIPIKRVTQVLLSDGWHLVKEGSSTVGELGFTVETADHGPVDISAGVVEPILAARWTDRDGPTFTVAVAAIQAIQSN